MRLPPSTVLWLAAASSVGTVRGEDNITFTNSDFTTGQNGAAVFVPYGSQNTHEFHWVVNQRLAVTIKAVNLRAVDLTLVGTFSDGSSSAGSPPVSMPTPTPTTTGDEGGIPHTIGAMRGHGIVPIMPILGGEWRSGGEKRSVETASTGTTPALPGIVTMTPDSNGLSGTVTIANLTQLGESQFASQELWLELVWDASDAQHTVYSRAFTVTTVATGDAATLASNPIYSNTTAVQKESLIPNGSGSGIGLTTTPPSATPTSTPLASATAVDPMGGSGTTPSRPSSSGLSTGAIAGIAVAAAVIGLALLAVLLFCLVRRRRRRGSNAPLAIDKTELSPVVGGYGDRTPDLIAQKEANAGVAGVGVVDVATPHSPYSDEGGGRGMPPRGTIARRQEEMPLAAGYADDHHHHRRPSVGGREAGDGESLRGSQGGRVSPGRETPTAVRHLVEEGMTEDEIRRLEEEERELDQAIEQAGGGRR